MSADITVRPVSVDDAEQVIAILNPIIVEGLYTVFDEPISVDEERDYIRGLTERSVFLVAESASEGVVGFQSVDAFHAPYTRAFDHVGVIGTYVAEAYRRQGVARALFPRTFAAASQAAYEKIFSFIRADNLAALAAYRSHGFTVIGTAKQQAKLNGRYIDEVLIERALNLTS
ncbi:MAG: GNAT family N-acetyltransferase [Acidobacteria bacterium]|nr:GNAT family N-acetyltransferase [Acidobacteriota bacterium]MDA1234590.1 GNAT family N-acetyltransferase [Acidobacteriota bacterium]